MERGRSHDLYVMLVQEAHHTATLWQLREKLWEATGEEPHPTTVARFLREAQYSTKQVHLIPAPRNTPEAIEVRRNYCVHMARVDRDTLVFLDESGFNLHTHRRRGRSRIGSHAISTVPASKGGNISLLAAISPVYGLLKYTIKIGSIKGDDYAVFMSALLAEMRFQCKAFSIVQDNATIHKVEAVKECFKGTRMKHLQVFLPPYSPQLNPIELMFSSVKAYVKINEKPDQNALLTLMDEGCQRITSAMCEGWYNEVTRFYVHCAAGQPLL